MGRSSDPSIHFYFKDVSFALKDRKNLKDFIVRLFRKEQKELSVLNYVFCTDEEILRINRKFLDHNYFTDVISFDLSTAPKRIEGEIYISVDRIRENARFFKVSTREEVCRVLFHGALHLCGYNDKSLPQKKTMKKKEDFYLRKYLIVSRET
ncbi:MAG: rRNA maturation RNase YbeY [Bacteroidetes bacterium]|nr:MAG: rRNA maturation RNase YbeY [Bacteroidota bacterium]